MEINLEYVDWGSPGSGFPATINCPCGSGQVHINRVEVDRGGNHLTVNSAVSAELSMQKNSWRGAFVIIGCWCEEGCTFDIRIFFRKGSTFMGAENWKRQAFVQPDGPSDLWRD